MPRNNSSERKPYKKYKSNFLEKLYSILSEKSYDYVICWSDDGTYIKILDPATFQDLILPGYYKHSNMKSFIRQLNIYEFHKITKENETCKDTYQHPSFKRDQKELLQNIKRNQKKQTTTPEIRIDPGQSEISEQFFEQKDKVIKTSEFETIRTVQSQKSSQGMLKEDEFCAQLEGMSEIVRMAMDKYCKEPPKTIQATAKKYSDFKRDIEIWLGFKEIDKE